MLDHMQALADTELPLKVAGGVGEDFACSILLEGARGWIELPAWLLRNAHKLILARGAVLSQTRRNLRPPKKGKMKSFKGLSKA